MQLRENVWTIQVLLVPKHTKNLLQKIEFGMYIVIVCMVVNLAIILIPIFILSEREDTETLQWWQWAANINIAV